MTPREPASASVDDEPVATAERIATATALRALGHAIVGHHVDDEALAGLRRHVEEFLSEIGQNPSRSRPVADMKRHLFDAPPPDGGTMEHYPDCVVSGPANPMGVAITAHREGDEAVATVALGAAFEGAPGRAHGGIVAAVFDDVLGFVLSMLETPAFTGRLSVSYLAPTPLGRALEFRARLVGREGRKITIEGEARDGETCFARAEGLFISIPPERFGLGAPSAG